jgi:Arc/MetJ-type ribon-helix-helix transcriptional regulator
MIENQSRPIMPLKLEKRKKNYTVRLPPVVVTPEMSEQLRVIAEGEGSSLSEVVRFGLSLFLQSRSRKSTHKIEKQSETAAVQS